jgi:hypothetical protein
MSAMRASWKRYKVFVLLGLVAMLLIPVTGLTQSGNFPGGGPGGARFPGGGMPGGGFPGGGMPGGGFPGGGFGDRSRGFTRDPNERFNEYTGGKDVWRRSEITDPRTLDRFDRTAQALNITSGEITRQQYVQYSTQMQSMFASRFGGGMTPPGAPSASPTPGASSPTLPTAGTAPAPGGNVFDSMVEGWFRRYDKNGDGLLNNDEMPDALKAEREKWDTNKDGFIDLNEFKAYAQARMQELQAERGAGGFGRGGNQGGTPSLENPLENEEDKRPSVVRAGKLPKELPAWFREADTDGDAQIGLYEWRAKGWPIEQFQAMDRNNDGFLTVDEVLRAQNGGNPIVVASAADGTDSPGAGPGSAPTGGAPGGFGRGRGGFGGPTGGMPGGGGGGFSRGRGGFGGPPGGGSGFPSGGAPSWGGGNRGGDRGGRSNRSG